MTTSDPMGVAKLWKTSQKWLRRIKKQFLLGSHLPCVFVANFMPMEKFVGDLCANKLLAVGAQVTYKIGTFLVVLRHTIYKKN